MTKSKNKTKRLILGILSFVGIILISYFLIIYLSVPYYTYNTPEPFHGEILHNPYQGMNPDHWRRYNFHSHSNRYGLFANGRNNTAEEVDSIYAVMGYDHVSISDYNSINRYGSDRADYIPVYEHGYGLFRRTHQLGIGAQKVRKIDYPFSQNLDIKQHNINKMKEGSALVALAHPSYTRGYKVSDMKYLSNYDFVEVLNPYGRSFEHWDMALSNGHRVYILADDDSHNAFNPNEIGRHFNMINSPDLAPDNILSSLKNGMSYGVDFNIYYNEPFERKIEGLKGLPHLTRAELIADTFFVETSQKMRKIDFIGQGGQVLKTMENVSSAYYVIQPNDTYVRTEIRLPNFTYFYLNPVTRHETNSIDKQRLDVVNPVTTWFYRLIYITTIALLIRMLIKRRKEKHDETNPQQNQ